MLSNLIEPAVRDGPRYRAFISYSHRDSRVARWLHRAIESYRVPRELVGRDGEHGAVTRRLSPVFRDEEELAGAAELKPELEDALRDSAALIVICSPASGKSPWVDREIRFFKSAHPGRPVLAVIAAGEPGECFPEALHYIRADDGELVRDGSIEPLAPDLRKLDRQVVLIKLIAGLLGVKYNDLYRRERRRARRLIAAAGTAAFLVITALATLSVVAIRQRDLAVEARKLAEHNAELAERRAWLAQVAAEEVRRQAELLQAQQGEGSR